MTQTAKTNENTKAKKRGAAWMDTLFLLTVGTLLVWSLSMGIISGTELVFNPLGTLVRIFFIMAAIRLIFFNKFTLIFTAAVIVVAFMIMGLQALTFSPTPNEVYAEYSLNGAALPQIPAEPAQPPILFQIADFTSRTIGYVTGFEFYDPAYDTAIQWALNIGLALFVFLLGFLWFNFFAILSTVLIFGIVLNSGFFFYDLSFYIFVFAIVAYLIKFLNESSIREGRGSPFVLYALPFTAICLSVAISLPTPQPGAAAVFTENFLRRPFNAINDGLQDAFAPRHFSLAQTGFGMGNTRRLGGNVTANYDRFMRINHQGPIYLTGNVFDQYTGYSWLNSTTDERYTLDFNEFAANIEAFERLTGPFTVWADYDFFDTYIDTLQTYETYLGQWRVGYRSFGISWQAIHPRPITPRQLRQQATNMSLVENRLVVEHYYRKFTVFTTGMVTNVSTPYGINFVRDVNGSVQADALMARGARYDIIYADLPAEINRTQLLSASRHGLYADVAANLAAAEAQGFGGGLLFRHNGIAMDYPQLLREYLIPRAAQINEKYTALPDHFPERVAELAHYVVGSAGAVTNLDKAVVLEDFLRHRGGFRYSLTPGAPPLDRDFVDYFLFDLRIGYCTYFASAFVTMARTLGLPARYVEGFIVTGDADEHGYLAVINRQGHAWGEVYFEGFGWHRFDPTPPAAIFQWPEAYHNFAWYEYWDEHFLLMGPLDSWDAYFPDYLDAMYYDVAFPGLGPGAAADANINAVGLRQVIITSLLITLLLALAILAARALTVVLKNASINKMDNNDAAVAYFHQMLRYMRLFRFEIAPHETAIVFAARIGKRISFENDRILMTDLAQIFSRAHYGREEISEDDRQRMAAAARSLDKRLWNYMGPRKYVMYKYIMCVV